MGGESVEKSVLIYWWNIAPLCLCTLTFLLTSFSDGQTVVVNRHGRPNPQTQLVPTIMRILAAISMLRACFFAAVLAWPDVGYNPPTVSKNISSAVLLFNATNVGVTENWRQHGGELICELVWQAGALLLFSLFVFICGAWNELVRGFKLLENNVGVRSGTGSGMIVDDGDFLSEKKDRSSSRNVIMPANLGRGGSINSNEVSLIVERRGRVWAGPFSAVRIWGWAMLAAAVVQIVVFVLSLLGIYGMRGMLFLDVLLYEVAQGCCMIAIAICSKKVLVILDRVNICGGPTTCRMKTVRRFAHVCNTFLTATLAVGALQLCALSSRFFAVLSRHWGAIRVAKAMLEMAFFWVLFYLLNSGNNTKNRRSLLVERQRLQHENGRSQVGYYHSF